MKKQIGYHSLVYAFLLVFAMLLWVSQADAATPTSGSCGETVQWSLDKSSGVLTISGSGAMADYALGLAAPWYNHSDYIKEVVVEEGITRIGGHAFEGNETVAKVIISESVTEIGAYAFSECTHLGIVWCKGSLPKTGKDAIKGVKTLLISPASDTGWNVQKWEQYKKETVDGITIHSGEGNVLGISGVHGDYRWEVKGCTLYIASNVGAQQVRFPGSPPWGACARAIEKIVLDDDVKIVGHGAFKEFENLTEVVWGDGIEWIGVETFGGCRSLQKIVLPASVSSISRSAFFGCESLQDIELSEKLETIDYNAFRDCASLESLTMPSGLKRIEEDAFVGCTALKSIRFTGAAPSLQEVVPMKAVQTEKGTIAYEMGMDGALAGIRNVTLYYPEGGQGWTEEFVQKQMKQYDGKNLNFISYSGNSGISEIPSAETTEPVEETNPTPTEQTVPQESLNESIPITEETTADLLPEESTQTNPATQENEKNAGTKRWIIIVTLIVVAAGAVVAMYVIQQKKRH